LEKYESQMGFDALMWQHDAVSEFICDALMWQCDAVSEFIWAKYVAVQPRNAVPVDTHNLTLAHQFDTLLSG